MNILNDFFQKIFGTNDPSAQQTGITGEESKTGEGELAVPGSVPDNNKSVSEVPSTPRPRSRRRRNPVNSYIMHQLERLADRIPPGSEKKTPEREEIRDKYL
jgi:hypothetical protein